MRRWRRKRKRLQQLEAIAAARIELRTADGSPLISTTCEGLYYIAKYGHEGRMEDREEVFTFVYDIR